ncbi:MAG: hypothetical protein BWK80_29095 [Desulfobacteraceae bacterium IS3]|nr:MAG: hypothetical protein BWK80_29095 [Desulfobacteraceae bacterium IS3]
MTHYAIDGVIKNGHLELDNVPFPDNVEVLIFIVPKVDLSQMSFEKVRQLTKGIKGNIADAVNKERDER